ncbi:hypothetical protein [Bradyrhizobium japonicum]|uniref:hypothetical protein n=1 Tax=Bradyrhizobium japonicum TaxID=375 RepID=UPI001B8A0369|nr:hypothetical protein [Bradyrhizobium japonicum]MBR0969614.1 hypothetical protein [Bradyrhizobium japonicum]
MRAIGRNPDSLTRESANGPRGAIGCRRASGHLRAGRDRVRGAFKAPRLSIDKRSHVQLLLHIAVERVRRTRDAVDFRGDGIERTAGRILAFDDGKGFKNCTHDDFPSRLSCGARPGAIPFVEHVLLV